MVERNKCKLRKRTSLWSKETDVLLVENDDAGVQYAMAWLTPGNTTVQHVSYHTTRSF